MDRKTMFWFEIVLLIIHTKAMNVFQPKYFCGSLLSDTLMKYNCVYHEVKTLDYVVETSGIVKECCFQKCSEYDLVKSYCSQSDLDSIPKEMLTTPKVYSEEIQDDIPSNMLQKDESSKNQNKNSHREVGKRKTNNKNNKTKRRNNNKSTNNKTNDLNKSNKKGNGFNKNCPCNCIKTRSAINKETILKSPVIGITNFSRNSVIRLASFRSNSVHKL